MFRRFLAVVLASLFLVLAPFALLAVAVQALLLDPSYFKQQLVEIDAYPHVYAEVVPALTKSVRLPQGLPFDDQDVESLVRRAVPESFVRAQTEKAIDDLYAVMTSEKERLEIVVPLAEIKQRIPDDVVAILDDKLAKLPPCSEATPGLSGLSQQSLSNQGEPIGLPTCLPSGVIGESLKSVIRQRAAMEAASIASGLPDSIDLVTRIGGSEELQSRLRVLRGLESNFLLAAQVLYVLLIVVAITVGALGGSSFNSGVGWIGLTLLLSGVAVLLLTIWVTFAMPDALVAYANTLGAPKELTPTVSALITSTRSDLMRRVQLEAAGMSVAGFLLFYVSRLI